MSYGNPDDEASHGQPPRPMAFAAEVGDQQHHHNVADIVDRRDHSGEFAGYLKAFLDGGQGHIPVRIIHA